MRKNRPSEVGHRSPRCWTGPAPRALGLANLKRAAATARARARAERLTRGLVAWPLWVREWSSNPVVPRAKNCDERSANTTTPVSRARDPPCARARTVLARPTGRGRVRSGADGPRVGGRRWGWSRDALPSAAGRRRRSCVSHEAARASVRSTGKGASHTARQFEAGGGSGERLWRRKGVKRGSQVGSPPLQRIRMCDFPLPLHWARAARARCGSKTYMCTRARSWRVEMAVLRDSKRMDRRGSGLVRGTPRSLAARSRVARSRTLAPRRASRSKRSFSGPFCSPRLGFELFKVAFLTDFVRTAFVT